MLKKRCEDCGHTHFFLKFVERNEKIECEVFEQICAQCGWDNVFKPMSDFTSENKRSAGDSVESPKPQAASSDRIPVNHNNASEGTP